jgi:hypothetical protein
MLSRFHSAAILSRTVSYSSNQASLHHFVLWGSDDEEANLHLETSGILRGLSARFPLTQLQQSKNCIKPQFETQASTLTANNILNTVLS